jgi:hypothetical protein
LRLCEVAIFLPARQARFPFRIFVRFSRKSAMSETGNGPTLADGAKGIIQLFNVGESRITFGNRSQTIGAVRRRARHTAGCALRISK